MSRLSIIARRRRYRRLLPFSTSDFLLGERRRQKRGDEKGWGTQRGASDFQPSLSRRFLFYVLSPLSMFTCSQFFSLCSSPPPFSFRDPTLPEKHIIIETLSLLGTWCPVVKILPIRSLFLRHWRKCSVSYFLPLYFWIFFSIYFSK